MRRTIHQLPRTTRGMSLLEVLVALFFTAVLMAGMGKIYQSSLSLFKTTSERIGMARKGRVALDILSDDLDRAGMYLADLSGYPQGLSDQFPGFFILPNSVVDLADGSTHYADELYFYLDDALPFQGTLNTYSGINNQGQAIADQTAFTAATVPTYDVTLTDPAFTSWVTNGVNFMMGDSAGAPAMTATNITVTGGANITFQADISKSPNAGVSKASHQPGTVIFFLRPAQMVRYYVGKQALDPSDPTALTPCLMRDQGAYNPGAFNATRTDIVAEDVLKLKVYLSADGGQTWAGSALADTTNGFSAGWINGIVPALNNQLSTYGQSDIKDIKTDNHWYRKVPTLVRLDVTTRTAVKRADYSATPSTSAAYATQVRSLIVVPRHFGLSYQ